MRKHILLILAVLIVSTILQAQSFKIIVNENNPISSINSHDASAYFLKKKTRWSDNIDAAPIDLNSKSDIRKAFSEAIHKKSVNQIRAFWQQSVFTGKATPPREVENDNDVIAFVRSNRGAIGYISANTTAQGVKVISLN